MTVLMQETGLVRGSGLGVRLVKTQADTAACQALRYRCFFGHDGIDADAYDPLCLHVMITGPQGLLGTCRVMVLDPAMVLERSYAAQFYDLTGFAARSETMLEVGRFCVAPEAVAADVLRLAWGALASLVDKYKAEWLFGCTSFPQANPSLHADGLALLGAHYQGPPALRPRPKARDILPLDGVVPDRRAAVTRLPRLLRSYLRLGGWVGDHAVIDQAMNTLHVFTAVEVAAIPPARARTLRMIMAG